MHTKISSLFAWANKIGDANINNRILAKVMPLLMREQVVLTHAMIEKGEFPQLSEEIYNAIKESAENLLNASYEEGE